MRKMQSCFTAAAVAAAIGAGSPPVLAQEPGSRAAELERAQQEKASAVSPHTAHWLERRLIAIERGGGFGVLRGPSVTFGDIKRGSGIALGPAYGKIFGGGTMLQAKAAYSIRNFKVAQLSFQSAPLASGRLLLRSRVRWQDAPTVPLFALGPDSPNTRTEYAETKTEFSGAAVFRPLRPLGLGAGISFERFDTGIARRANPALGYIFAGVPGVDADPSYLHGHASVEIDSRDGEGYSRHGSLLRATLHDYRQQNTGPHSFQRVDGVAEQYIPILHGNWVIYLGVRASTTTARAGQTVPFFLMPDIGGHDLRGFGNYRFRDRHSVLVTAEYRWYAQEYVDGAIFYDAGKAVADRSALDFSGLKSSVGAGIRFHAPRTTVLRFEIARSREGLRLILSFSPVGG
jgi:hypothetical protein